MTDTLHVKAFRLFDRSKAELSGEDFQLKDWEQEHLQGCEESQEVLAVFVRLHSKRPPSLPANGDINQQDGWYENVCCGIEVFIPAGQVFPDCRRHKNLPTAWKPIQRRVA